jgi:hypothetical protein
MQTDSIYAHGVHAFKLFNLAHDLLCRLCDAFQEAQQGLQVLNDLTSTQTAADEILERLEALQSASVRLRDKLSRVISQIELSAYHVVLEGESFSSSRLLYH